MLCGAQRDVIRSSEEGSHAQAGLENNLHHLSEEMESLRGATAVCCRVRGELKKKKQPKHEACDDWRRRLSYLSTAMATRVKTDADTEIPWTMPLILQTMLPKGQPGGDRGGWVRREIEKEKYVHRELTNKPL